MGLAPNYKVVDKQSGQTVATYGTQGAIGQPMGNLNVSTGLDGDLHIIIMTIMSEWVAMMRRQPAISGAAGAGAGVAAL